MIYLLDTKFVDLGNNDLYKDLSRDRIDKINRLVFEKDKKLSLGAGLLLNFVIKDYCEKQNISCPDFPLDIIKNQYEKPILKDGNIHFNLSHSGRYVVCVADNRPVGIDIQKIGKTNVAFSDRIMSEKEKRLFGADTKRALMVFCMKEAILKKQGIGLSCGLNNIELYTDNADFVFEGRVKLHPLTNDDIYTVDGLQETLFSINDKENVLVSTAVFEDDDGIYLLAKC